MIISYRAEATGLDSIELAARIRRAGATEIGRTQSPRERPAPCSSRRPEIFNLCSLMAAQREDLNLEYQSLDWTLGVVDLRQLLAFQRRLIFSPSRHICPRQDKMIGLDLVSLAVGSQRGTEHLLVHNASDTDRLDIGLHSSNPDLQLRFTPQIRRMWSFATSLYGGSPFFEVAELRGTVVFA